MHTVLVELTGPQKVLIEIDIHDAAANKIGITEGAALKINLSPEFIFLLSDESPISP